MTRLDKKKKISLFDLHKYSEWYEILNGKKETEVRKKSKKEVLREFENEKWKSLYEYLRKNPNLTVLDVDKILYSNKINIPIFFENNFYMVTPYEAHRLHIDLYVKVISKYLEEGISLIEFGAGYGSKILNLSLLKPFKNTSMTAGELTLNGQKIIKKLSDNMNKNVKSIYCDLGALDFSEINIPENSIIFTSYSAHYVPFLNKNFVEKMLSLKPKVVIHFEPCYELNSSKSKFELMCKKYIEINDYNRNLFSVLKANEKEEKINLFYKKNIIGSNPFLPISVIEWSPLE